MRALLHLAAALGLTLLSAACIGEEQKIALPQPAVAPPASPDATAPAALLPVKPAPSGSLAALAATFNGARAYRDVEVLADPSYMGRHVGTPGEEKGAQYMSDQFRVAGLQPGGDNGTYIQEFPMTVTELTTVPELVILGAGGQQQALRLRDDFRPLVVGPLGPGTAEGEGYFAGYGESLGEADVRGRVVILVIARRALRDIIPELRQAGAAGLIVTTGSQPILKGEAQRPDPDALPAALVSREGFDTLIRAAGRDPEALRQATRDRQDLPTFPLGARLRMSAAVETKDIVARNVIGVLPGTGEDVVVVGGHYEEIGPDPDGVVYPAANDNASGTAVVLELARFLRENGVQPQASVVFIGWSGHEEGLFGSAYYMDHPTLPVDRTRAYLNIDVVGGGSGPNLIAAVEDGNLQSLSNEVKAELETATGQPTPLLVTALREGSSDHTNFRRRGVPPVAYSWEGLFATPIHTPQDDATAVDPEKLRITGQITALTLLKLIQP